MSELLVPKPSEGGQVLAAEMAKHLTTVHDFRSLGPCDAEGPAEPLMHPTMIGFRALARAARSRDVVYFPKSGVTYVSLLRVLALRLATMRGQLTVVVTQIHLRAFRRLVLRALRIVASHVVVATDAQRQELTTRKGTPALIGIRVQASKVSSLTREQARGKIGQGAGHMLLHVGHAQKGRGLELLSGFTPPARCVIVLSSVFAEEAGAVPAGPGIEVVRGHVPNLSDYYRAANAYVFPTTSAQSVIGVPMSIVESLANGTPVVAIRSEVTKRLEGLPGLTLVEEPDDLISAAQSVAGSEPTTEVKIPSWQACLGEFAVCHGSSRKFAR